MTITSGAISVGPISSLMASLIASFRLLFGFSTAFEDYLFKAGSSFVYCYSYCVAALTPNFISISP